LPETLNLTVAQLAAVGTERRPPRVACCFQLLPCGDQRLGQFIRSHSDVDAETLQPLLLLQAPKLQLRDLHAQAGLPLSGGDLLGNGQSTTRLFAGCYVSTSGHRLGGRRCREFTAPSLRSQPDVMPECSLKRRRPA
jgi:hypothetical protein